MANQNETIGQRSGDTETSLQAIQKVMAAAHFAAEKHVMQRRKGRAREPYLNHLIEVAQLVSASLSEPDTNLIVAALLHDAIEDQRVTRDELVSRFGSDVANLVEEVTDDKSLKPKERKRLQVVNAPKKSVRAQAIKMADKISNLRSILYSPPVGWTVGYKRRYFRWAKEVVDGFTSPNPVLKAEFDLLYSKIDQVGSGRGNWLWRAWRWANRKPASMA